MGYLIDCQWGHDWEYVPLLLVPLWCSPPWRRALPNGLKEGLGAKNVNCP